MDAATRARHDALRKETIVGAMMNVLVGAVFFMLVFGWHRSATMLVALDFFPQTLGMTFLGGMVSSLICLSKIDNGSLLPAGSVPARKTQSARVFACAVGATGMFGTTVALALVLLGPSDLSPTTAFAMKSVYGFAMSFVTTPFIVRIALGMPFWPRVRYDITADARP